MKKFLKIPLCFKRTVTCLGAVLLSFQTYSQSNTMTFKSDMGEMAITTLMVDTDATIIFGGYSGLQQPTSGFICKADAYGEVLWTKRVSNPFVREIIADNGDYLLLNSGSFGNIARIKKNGDVKWYKFLGYSNSVNETFTGISELPNGNIVVCGTNDFDYNGSNLQYQGYLFLLDSLGAVVSLSYYGQSSTLITDQYHFNDVSYFNSKLYAVGSHYPTLATGGAGRAMILTTDISGQLIDTKIMDDSITIGNDTITNIQFLNINTKYGKLQVSGKGITSDGNGVAIIADIDTNNWSANIKCVSLEGTSLDNPTFNWMDTNHVIVCAKNYQLFTANTQVFIASTEDATFDFEKQITFNNNATINSLGESNNGQIIIAGLIISPWPNPSMQPIMGIYDFTEANTDLCNVDEASLNISQGTGMFTSPSYAPDWNYYPYTSYSIPMSTSCIYNEYICGDTLCSPNFNADINVIGSAARCVGDTIQLISSGCRPKIWLKDGELINDSSSNILNSTESGAYSVIISNLACIDTSESIAIAFHNIQNPVIEQHNDSLICSNIIDGLSYQWYNESGDMIPGAINPYYIPQANGGYSVNVLDSFGCSSMSSVYVFRNTDVINPQDRGRFLKVYPNPARDFITIDVASNKAKNASVSLINILGQVVFYTHNLSDSRVIIPVHNIADGIYTIIYNTTDGIETVKRINIVK